MLLLFLQLAPLLEEVLPSVYASQRMKLSVEAKRVVVDVSFLAKFSPIPKGRLMIIFSVEVGLCIDSDWTTSVFVSKSGPLMQLYSGASLLCLTHK
jgi:hypothetical protein